MCDYSLELYKTVDAKQGATYTVTRFPTGTIGVLDPAAPVDPSKLSTETLCAVCIKDNTVIMVGDDMGVFAKIDPPMPENATLCNRHRDGIRFDDGRSVSLQEIAVGTAIKIVMLAAEAPEDASLSSPEVTGVPV